MLAHTRVVCVSGLGMLEWVMAEFAHCEDEVWDRQNGVCGLCGDPLEGTDCHHFAHDYDWRLGALLEPHEFPYWFGHGVFGGAPLPDY